MMNLKGMICLFLLSISFINMAVSVPKLMIKIPTRSRPKQFFNILNKYYKNLSGEIPYLFLITCDEDDLSMNNSKVLKKLRSYPNLHVYFSKNSCKVEAYNKDIDTHINDFDILLVTSDDAYPLVKGYDKIIVDSMLKNFPDYDGVLNINDGYVGADLNTLPIIGKKYYQRFNYVYHPSYRSLCCDNELTLVSKILDKEAILDQVIIIHEHPANNPLIAYDDLYRRNDKWLGKDLSVFKERRAQNFFLDISKNASKIKWSILICTLEERKEIFSKIYKKLMSQIKNLGLENKIEVLFFCDNREHKVGYKRNELLRRSKGQYICFIDDDDDVDENYIKMIYNKLVSNPDCVSLTGIITTNGKDPRSFIHSIKYKTWFKKNGIYYRPPNHLNPIKRSIAIQFLFPEINYGEDAKWSMDISNSELLKNEEIINIPYYFYLYKPKK